MDSLERNAISKALIIEQLRLAYEDLVNRWRRDYDAVIYRWRHEM